MPDSLLVERYLMSTVKTIAPNAKQHGLLDKSTDDLPELTAEYHRSYDPVNATERFLVDTLVNNEWRLRRLRRVEVELWEHAADIVLARKDGIAACSFGASFAVAGAAFEALQQVVDSCECNYHRAANELQRLLAERAQSRSGRLQ
jgi:hypothetical protein